jgi:hypothetical protein
LLSTKGIWIGWVEWEILKIFRFNNVCERERAQMNVYEGMTYLLKEEEGVIYLNGTKLAVWENYCVRKSVADACKMHA